MCQSLRSRPTHVSRLSHRNLREFYCSFQLPALANLDLPWLQTRVSALLRPIGVKTHQVTAVCPHAELHFALLSVEREEFHVDITLTLVDGRRLPLHFSRVFDGRLCHHCNNVVAVSAVALVHYILLAFSRSQDLEYLQNMSVLN